MSSLPIVAKLRMTIAKEVSRTWRYCLTVILVLAFVSSVRGATATAQLTPANSSTSVSASDTGADDSTSARTSSDRVAGQSSSLPGSPSLTSSQIISVLNEQPEALMEVKSLVADRLSQTGTPVREEDISDEVLYRDLAGNSDLRSSVATFLRARGYTGEVDLDSPSGAFSPPDSLLTAGSGVSSLREPGSTGELTDGVLGNTRAPTPDAVVPSQDSLEGIAERAAPAESSTNEPKVLRQRAPYNLQALRDLYTQIPDANTTLKRFGSELFLRSARASMSTRTVGQTIPLDVPIGPDYVLGSGDTLVLKMWGASSQTFTLMVDREGRLLLPEAGSLAVAGLTLAQAQTLIESAMQEQFRNAHVSVTVARLRSVRVYVVGDVQRPGGYDVSPLATPLSVLYAAGGPTASGSLRTIRVMRGDRLVKEADLYDLLLHGVRADPAHFESGDTLLVPPRGPQVAISGGVLRPAIYELCKPEDTLAAVIDDAGGPTVAAALDHITIERIDAHHARETMTLDAGALKQFNVRDGDRILISSILPYSQRAIYLEGHVVRPGRLPWVDGMHLTDVLHSYRDMLPEPDTHGEVVRLVPPDLHPETIDFDLAQVLIGNDNLALQPFDTIRIRGRYELDAPKVTVNGEVLRPGTFPLSKDMTVAQLVRVAGGFKRDAFLDTADLTSYSVVEGKRVASSLTPVHIGAAVNGTEPQANVELKPGDILTVHQVTGWNDIGESVRIEGQVAYPGSYGLRDGERLSSVLRRAGGFRDTAYPEGTVLVREEVRELEEKSRQELIRQIETSSAAARLSPNLASGESGAALQVINAQQQQILSRLKSQPPTGRLVVHIESDIDKWANTPADVELRRGDVVTIPKRPGFVLVTGQVYNPTALTFTPGKSAGWYLSHAGGSSTTADRKDIFVIRANGSVIGRRSGHFIGSDVLSTKLNPGDVVVVPQKIVGASQLWKNLMTAAQLASSISITAAVAAL
ncbi:MAG TPA: SLBB domain-containing protein [Acidobacteriaceae bacterium]|nr:SLBB domain-containing protein [Acidobacteriaceae bacterium]